MRSRFREGFSLVVTLVAPAALAMAIVARAFIEVFLQRGHFDAIDTERTASVLITLAIGLPFFSAYLFTLRVFYARKDTRTPFFLNLAENAINIVLAFTFFEIGLGVGGLGLAYSLAYLSALVGSLVVAQRRIGGIIDGRLLRMFVNAGLAAVGTGLPMAIVISFVRNVVDVDSPLLELVLAVPLGLMGLLATITVFDIEGFESVSARLRPRARR